MINPLWNTPGDLILTTYGQIYRFTGVTRYYKDSNPTVMGVPLAHPHAPAEEINLRSILHFGPYRKDDTMDLEKIRKGDKIRSRSGNRYIFDYRDATTTGFVCHSIDDDKSRVLLKASQIAEVSASYDFPDKEGLYKDSEGRIWLMVNHEWRIIRAKNGHWVHIELKHTPTVQDGWGGPGFSRTALPLRRIKDIIIDTNGDNADACGLYA